MSESADQDAVYKADRLRAAVVRDYPRLCVYIGSIVQRYEGLLPFDRLRERVEEVIGVAVERALERAASYDVRKAAFPWLVGMAVNVLRELGRAARRSQVRQTDLGEGWEKALESLVEPGGADADADTERLRRALARLKESDRQVLELGLVRGLSSAELARAVGAPSPEAARTRLCRALRALREAFERETGDADGGGEGHEP